ncbi:hypothetical protein [Pseudofulvibacter geojedonensis]|uniref:Uncharacterized protein n=1 Tax=Pseudofulvibacter geojedonensis TaxID=1123758 RepID=A0ABW3I103_9FLAO
MKLKHLKKFSLVLSTLTFNLFFAQIPIEKFKNEIASLDTNTKQEAYWKKLNEIDQNILLKTENIIDYDSISTCNMIRSVILIEKHNSYSNHVPIANLSHSVVASSNLIYWPIIKKCANKYGYEKLMGGKAYILESYSISFYGYSLYKQNNLYESLLEKLNQEKNNSKSIIENLVNNYIKQKKYSSLKEVKVIGRWQLQPFKNLKEDGSFAFIKMNDKNLYMRKHKRLQKLIFFKVENNVNFYKIDNEPFGWYYSLDENNNLKLHNEKEEVLIAYSKK